MKILRFSLISFFVLFGLLVLASNSSVEAAEFCWTDGTGGRARLEITHVGHGHYSVNGRHTDDSGNVEVVNGNGEVVDGQFVMHITSSSFDADEVRSFLATIVLELPATNFNGTLEGLSLYYDKSTGSSGISFDGPITLTRVPCP